MAKKGRVRSRRHQHRKGAQAARHAAEPLDPDAVSPVTAAEVRLFGRAIREMWEIPKAAMDEGIALLRKAQQSKDLRTATAATKTLATIQQRSLAISVQVAKLDQDARQHAQDHARKLQELELRREHLGIAKEALHKDGPPTSLEVKIEYANDYPPPAAAPGPPAPLDPGPDEK